MTTQIELFRADRADVNVQHLVEHLRRTAGWQLAVDILRHWSLEESDQNRRFIRALAEAAGPDVLSGQRGYLHIEHASAEEINHAAGWMESQAVKMTSRALAIRRRAHQLVG